MRLNQSRLIVDTLMITELKMTIVSKVNQFQAIDATSLVGILYISTNNRCDEQLI